VIDPHKHGLQPYGCGCVVFRDPRVGNFTSTIRRIRISARRKCTWVKSAWSVRARVQSAAALWATQKLLPLVKGGEFARGLEDCRKAALDFYQRLEGDARFVTAFPPELDIVVFAPRAQSVSEASGRSRKIFEAAARRNLHLAVAELPMEFFCSGPWCDEEGPGASLTCCGRC